MEEVAEAKNLLSQEAYERPVAELNAHKESLEKQKIVNALLCSDRRYRKYIRDEIEAATDFFSENNVIGQRGYGKVYKCSLHRALVAIKVLRPDAVDRKEEFLKEFLLSTKSLATSLRVLHKWFYISLPIRPSDVYIWGAKAPDVSIRRTLVIPGGAHPEKPMVLRMCKFGDV
ncbi:hypothetical protein DITRI_Ditri08aG0033200 [Diplodiscus trichospermus]